MYQELMNIGEVAAAAYVNCLICDVEEELHTAEKYHLNKLSTGFDMVNVIDEQKLIHKKYKEKIKEV